MCQTPAPARLTRRQVAALLAAAPLAASSPLAYAVAQEAPPRLDRSGLVQTFADEFDTLDLHIGGRRGKWNTNFRFQANPDSLGNRTLTNNQELQVYVDPMFQGTAGTPLNLNPFVTRDGILRITASRIPEAIRPSVYNREFMSGLITTRGLFGQQYGVFETRARVPKGKGLWPAFWLCPADGSWPPEIDVIEILGHEPTKIHVTLHSRATGKHERFHKDLRVADTSADFHTYTVDWGKEQIAFYFDDAEIFRRETPGDMHKPMFVLANLAVGGWAGTPDASTQFPAVMEIDWIRVYRREGAG
jgi:beta-glucanase (GH16 family)